MPDEPRRAPDPAQTMREKIAAIVWDTHWNRPDDPEAERFTWEENVSTEFWSDDVFHFRHAADRILGLLEEERAAAARMRELLERYGGWVYFREEDPANPLPRGSDGRTARRGRQAPRKRPPGKYVQTCIACGAYRRDGHTGECPIGQALAPNPTPGERA